MPTDLLDLLGPPVEIFVLVDLVGGDDGGRALRTCSRSAFSPCRLADRERIESAYGRARLAGDPRNAVARLSDDRSAVRLIFPGLLVERG
jgi:hypothetical protein